MSKADAVVRPMRALGAALLPRIAPFLDLLDARYLPLLFVGAPQAYTVYAWLLASGVPEEIARLGGIGFEFVYVGSIAWAARGAGWRAARGPAVTALAFSVAVAVAHYGPDEGALAALHAGFPLVGYFYMLMMHAPDAPQGARIPWRVRLFGGAQVETAPAPVARDAEPVRALTADAPALSAHACKRCGASVETQQKAAASVRWGCGACKEGVRV